MRENQTELTAQLTPARAQSTSEVWMVISAAKKAITKQRRGQLFWATSICLHMSLLFVSKRSKWKEVPSKAQLLLCSILFQGDATFLLNAMRVALSHPSVSIFHRVNGITQHFKHYTCFSSFLRYLSCRKMKVQGHLIQGSYKYITFKVRRNI